MTVQLGSNNEDDDEGVEDAVNDPVDEQDEDHDTNPKQNNKQQIGLFIPSRNMQREAGKGKDNLIINPQKTSGNDIDQYHFLGMLMGVCIHTGTNVSIPLPSIVWKYLAGQRLQTEDIQEFDDGIITELEQMIKSENPDDFLSAD